MGSPAEWTTCLPMLAAQPGSSLGRTAAQSGLTYLTAMSSSSSVVWASMGQPSSWPLQLVIQSTTPAVFHVPGFFTAWTFNW